MPKIIKICLTSTDLLPLKMAPSRMGCLLTRLGNADADKLWLHINMSKDLKRSLKIVIKTEGET